MMEHLWRTDPEIARAVLSETQRQATTLEMIASENFVSEAVLEAIGSVLTNKYAEGYPGKRYYGGCEFVDICEDLARRRACELFGADHANVQPHSGSSANIAAYYAMMEHGDTLMGMSLAHGGHLTHGHKVNFSGSHFKIVQYELNPETERIDYDQVRKLAREHKPKVLLAGWSAYSRHIDFKIFREVADEVGAFFMVDMAHFAGLVVAGLYPNPVEHAHIVTSTTHKTLRGPRGGMILCQEKVMRAGEEWPLAKKLDSRIFPGYQGGPLEHIIAAKAVAFKEASTEEFKAYQRQIVANARALAKHLSDGGLRIVSGGTDTHLMLVDVTPLGLTGTSAEHALEAAGITANKNAIPFDKNPPAVASGIRLGTPALTTRGLKEPQMEQIAEWILEVLKAPEDEARGRDIRGKVLRMCEEFPLYRDRLARSREAGVTA